MSITYTPTTNFGAKDGLPSNDPQKVIKGAEFTTEFTAIQSAFNLAAPTSAPAFTGTATFSGLTVNGAFTSRGIDDNATSTAITIDASQNVGIGDATPDARLGVRGTNNTKVVQFDDGSEGGHRYLGFTSSSNGQGWDINSQGDSGGINGFLTFSTKGTEAMRINSNGNVGVGTDSPSYKTEISTNGTTYLGVTSGDSSLSGILLGKQSNKSLSRLVHDNTDNSLQLWSSSAERMRIDSSGKVGIGTSSPTYALDVETNTNGLNGAELRNTNSGSFAAAILNLASDSAALSLTCTSSAYNVVANWSDAGVVSCGSATSNGLILNAQAGGIKFNTAANERMRIDASGNVGIGAVTPNSAGLGANGQTLQLGTRTFIATDSNGDTRLGGLSGSNFTAFYQGGSERMRIDSGGRLLVGATSVPSTVVSGSMISDVESQPCRFSGSGTAGRQLMLFINSNGSVGSISTSGSATSYTTSSDERLKDNIVDAPAGNIDAIRVRSFDWKADGSHQTYGMIAQELIDVAPEAVTQGDTDEDMWGVDYMKFVTVLTGAIQEQQAMIEELKAEVAALKGA